MLDSGKTIVQLGTLPGASALHVLRLSGAASLPFLLAHTNLRVVEPRKIYLASFFADLAEENSLIDRLLCFYMRSPASYTGEDMVELQCHGSMGIVESILKVALREGLVLAGPGKFTWRAFLNGKMRLEQAEAVDALVRAGHGEGRRKALNVLEGKSSLGLGTVRKQLVDLMALLEANIEFPEQEVLEAGHSSARARESLYATCRKEVSALIGRLEGLLQNYDRGRRVEAGYRVLIMGRANAGKSTLMNALLREERVLVSEEAGTTRDSVEERLEVGGVSVWLADSAGLRSEVGPVEAKGIERSLQLAARADLILYLLFSEQCLEIASSKKVASNKKLRAKKVYLVSKADLWEGEALRAFVDRAKQQGMRVADSYSMVSESASSVVGRVESLLLDQLDLGGASGDGEVGGAALLCERHAVGVRGLLDALRKGLRLFEAGETEEVVLEGLSQAKEVLEEVDLPLSNEELYDRVFGMFCLGK